MFKQTAREKGKDIFWSQSCL